MEKQTTPIVKIGDTTKYALTVLILFIALFGILLVNKKSIAPEAEANTTSALSLTEDTFDFGTISMRNGKVSHRFEIKNNGIEAVTIKKVYTSCMCTVAFIDDDSGKRYGAFGMPGHGGAPLSSIRIDANTSAKVEAIFDPAAHGPSGIGLAQRSIYLETNSLSSPKLGISFQAMVTK